MSLPVDYSFPHYLSAKKSVDDRALNRQVWSRLVRELHTFRQDGPLRVLEVGAGIGTMAERWIEWNASADLDYLAIDQLEENVLAANQRLPDWAASRGYQVTRQGGAWLVNAAGRQMRVRFEQAELFSFAHRSHTLPWSVLVAHAFLDLMNVPATLPLLFRLLQPGGLFYFTINFDGLTLLEPELEASLDERIQVLYHRTMDERLTNERSSGDSRAGRHLFSQLRQSGAWLLEAGASDWVVFAGPHGYPDDEAYFLHFIIHTIQEALTNRPEMDADQLAVWASRRHQQVEQQELIYIAHQLDFLGRWDG